METFSSAELVASLGHTLWLGALIAGGLFAALRTIPARHANWRYGLSLAALGGLVAAWLVAWSWLEHSHLPQPLAVHTAAPGAAPFAQELSASPEPPRKDVPPRLASTPFHRAGSPDSQDVRRHVWLQWLARAWFLGALVFQLRILLAIGRARSLAARSHRVESADILSVFERAAVRLGLSRRARLAQHDRITCPAVFGLWKPVILLPVALVTRMSPAVLEAVLAHELAHIRRYDYLVNLLQMAVEGLLFFNPFAWWISRQIRIEREACCDALAGNATGRSNYAEALVVYAEWSRGDTAAPAIAMAMGSGRPLFERVRRVLYPRSLPALRLSVPGLISVMGLCFLALAGLKFTAAKAIEILSPAQRVARLAELDRQYPDYEVDAITDRKPDSRERITVSGRLLTDDGKPLPKGTSVAICSSSARSTGVYGIGVNRDTGQFSHQVPAGAIRLTAVVPGYAACFAGPLTGTNDLENLELVLKHGYEAAIRFVDPDGKPVPEVQLEGGYDFPASFNTIDETSDAGGRITLTGLADHPLRLSARTTRYQYSFRKSQTLRPNETLTWELTPGESTAGVVVSEDGKPVEGAALYMAHAEGTDTRSNDSLDERNLLAKAGPDGRFEIRSFRSDSRYYLLIAAAGFSGEVVGPISAGERNLKFELPAAQYVDVEVRNVRPEDLNRSGKLPVTYGYNLEFGNYSHGKGDRFEAAPVDGVARFHIGPLWKGEVFITVGGSQSDRKTGPVKLTWNEVRALDHSLKFDLDEAQTSALAAQSPAETRQLAIELKAPHGQPAPAGKLIIEYIKNGLDASGTRTLEHDTVPIRDGHAEFEVAVPNRVEVKPGGVIGYWFRPLSGIEVSNAPAPLRVTIDAVPAGAIYGRVEEADGQPATGIMISVVCQDRPPALEGGLFSVDVKNSTSSTDPANRFNAAPLPLDGVYRICAYRDSTYVFSEPLQLDATNPVREVTMTIPKGQTLRGQVLGPDGQPRAGQELRLDIELPGHGFSPQATWTGSHGQFHFEHFNPDVPADCYLELPSKKNVQPVRAPIRGTRPMRVQMKKGQVIEGRVVDAKTKRPIPGAEVYAMRPFDPDENPAQRWPTWFDPEGPTDGEGRFRFSNLLPGKYRINSRSGKLIGSQETVIAGAGRSVTLAIELYAWSKLGPAE